MNDQYKTARDYAAEREQGGTGWTAPRIPVTRYCETCDRRIENFGRDGVEVDGRPYHWQHVPRPEGIEGRLQDLVERAFAAGVQSVVEVPFQRELARRRYQRIHGEEIAKLAAELAR